MNRVLLCFDIQTCRLELLCLKQCNKIKQFIKTKQFNNIKQFIKIVCKTKTTFIPTTFIPTAGGRWVYILKALDIKVVGIKVVGIKDGNPDSHLRKFNNRFSEENH